MLTFGLAFQDFLELLFTEISHLLGVVVEASTIQFRYELFLFHSLAPPCVVFTITIEEKDYK
jgi:hypothetical protein